MAVQSNVKRHDDSQKLDRLTLPTLFNAWIESPFRLHCSHAENNVMTALIYLANKKWFPKTLEVTKAQLRETAKVHQTTMMKALDRFAEFKLIHFGPSPLHSEHRLKIVFFYDQILGRPLQDGQEEASEGSASRGYSSASLSCGKAARPEGDAALSAARPIIHIQEPASTPGLGDSTTPEPKATSLHSEREKSFTKEPKDRKNRKFSPALKRLIQTDAAFKELCRKWPCPSLQAVVSFLRRQHLDFLPGDQPMMRRLAYLCATTFKWTGAENVPDAFALLTDAFHALDKTTQTSEKASSRPTETMEASRRPVAESSSQRRYEPHSESSAVCEDRGADSAPSVREVSSTLAESLLRQIRAAQSSGSASGEHEERAWREATQPETAQQETTQPDAATNGSPSPMTLTAETFPEWIRPRQYLPAHLLLTDLAQVAPQLAAEHHAKRSERDQIVRDLKARFR